MVSTAKRQAAKGPPAQPLHEELGLNEETLLDMYYYMVLARKLDERMWQLNRQGKAAFVISCQGQEAAQIGTAFAMERGKDWFVPYYRDLALMLCLGQTPRMVMLSLFAKAEEPNSGGRQMPGHYGFAPEPRRSPPAAPSARSSRTRRASAWRPSCARTTRWWPCFGGEGSTSQGDWHEAMNFAGIHKLPVLFVIENNQYAISVPLQLQMAAEQRGRARGAAYGMPGVGVDGTEPAGLLPGGQRRRRARPRPARARR